MAAPVHMRTLSMYLIVAATLEYHVAGSRTAILGGSPVGAPQQSTKQTCTLHACTGACGATLSCDHVEQAQGRT